MFTVRKTSQSISVINLENKANEDQKFTHTRGNVVISIISDIHPDTFTNISSIWIAARGWHGGISNSIKISVVLVGFNTTAVKLGRNLSMANELSRCRYYLLNPGKFSMSQLC